MERRSFIANLSCLGLFSPLALKSTIFDKRFDDELKVTKVEVVRFSPELKLAGRGIQWMWVRLHTNQGYIGTGETYPFNEASKSAIKDFEWHSWMGKLLGSNPLRIEESWERIFRQSAYHVTGGAEMRALSALNMAQWDILGQKAGMPVYQLLGGSSNKKIPVYNTYTNPRHINNWTLESDIEKIAEFLVDKKIRGIKFCPFDMVGNRNKGQYISLVELDGCLDWIKRIRDTVGNQLEIGIEFHSIWNITSAIRIAEALAPYNIWFLEDMLLEKNIAAYKILANHTSIPLVLSERLSTRYEFREFFESHIGGVAMFDLCWCGGISEGKKIADMANTYFLPTMMHTAGGPLLWYASTHLAAAITNLFPMESVYQNYTIRYPYFFDNVPEVADGYVSPPNLPGLGLKFKKGLFESKDVQIETISS
jgi:galactonate dehydratase